MKKIRSLFLTILTVCNCLAAFAIPTIQGPAEVCAGDAVQYVVIDPPANGPTWSVNPSNAVNGMTMIGQQLFVQWNSTFFSGCSATATLTADYGFSFPPVNYTVTVYAKPQSGVIAGPNTVLPVNTYTNEFPVVQYSIGSVSCTSNIFWNLPSGWTIVSGQYTPTIQVQPSPISACSGNISVTLSGNGPCQAGGPPSKAVSRSALASGEITNLIQWQGTNNTLVICPDDELLVDASTTTFCGDPNEKLFVSFYVSNASWQNISEHNKWLSVSEYNALGGLSNLDIRAFLAAHHPLVTINASSYYKVKIAVSGVAWNERTFTVQTTAQTAPAPTFPTPPNPSIIVLNPGGTVTKDVRLIWMGLNTVDYEILYQYSDNATFPQPGTITMFTGCFFPSYYTSGIVYKDIFGLPAGYHFRYKVRECGCGAWSPWNTAQLKPGKPNDIEAVVNDNNIVNVYPNPAGDIITVELNSTTSSNAQIVIMDMTGKVIISQDDIQPDKKTEIDVSQLPSGLYMTVVTQGGEVLLKEKLSIIH